MTALSGLRAGRHPVGAAPSRRERVLLGVLAGVLALVGVAAPLGLLGGGTLHGIADNGDGPRMACGAGLVADTPDRTAPWHGVVVTRYRTDGPGCVLRVYPSSAAPLLWLTSVTDRGDPSAVWTLERPGLLYSTLLALGVAVAAVAASARSRVRALVVALPVLPLVVVPWWSRVVVSTFAEPAGLVGAAWVLLGGLAIAVTTRYQHRSRLLALCLVVAGGLLGGAAKPGFVPVAGVAVLVAAMTVLRAEGARRPRAWRWAGPGAAIAVVFLGAGPVIGALIWEDAVDARVNTHNLVFTAVLTEVGREATAPLGLPPEAATRAGEGYYWRVARGIPGWQGTVGTRPDQMRSAALGVLAAHPDAAARMLGRGITATMRPQLEYLSSAPMGTARESDQHRTTFPEAGMLTAPQMAWLDGVVTPWLPGAVGLAALAAAVATLRSDRAGTRVRLVRLALVSAASGVAVVGLAVVGDGYFELTKHVWLASYLFAVAALVLLAAFGATVLTTSILGGPRRDSLKDLRSPTSDHSKITKTYRYRR